MGIQIPIHGISLVACQGVNDLLKIFFFIKLNMKQLTKALVTEVREPWLAPVIVCVLADFNQCWTNGSMAGTN